MTRIKICGITNEDDAIFAAEAGADALGFIFYKNSPRFIEPTIAKQIVSLLPPFLSTIGVFVNESSAVINDTVLKCGLNIVQLHGDEPPDLCLKINAKVIKALRIKDRSSIVDMDKYRVSSILLDTFTKNEYGGSGTPFNWDLAVDNILDKRIILAGGLNPENVFDAINKVRPYGVDVSSGVEFSPGKKDRNKIVSFVNEVRRADYAAT